MKRALPAGTATRARRTDDTAAFTLRDIMIALSGGLTPAADGIEMMIDRIEGMN